jgi:hypothetical protein
MKGLYAIVVVSAALTASIRSAPLDRDAVAGDAKWVVHLDLEKPGVADFLDEVESGINNHDVQVTGIESNLLAEWWDALSGIRGITVYGTKGKGVVVLEGGPTLEDYVSVIGEAATIEQEDYQGTSLKRVTVKGLDTALYGAEKHPAWLVVSLDKDRVTAAIDVLDKRASSAKAVNSFTNLGTEADPVLALGGINAEQYTNVAQAAIKLVKRANVKAGESEGTASASAKLGTDSQESETERTSGPAACTGRLQSPRHPGRQRRQRQVLRRLATTRQQPASCQVITKTEILYSAFRQSFHRFFHHLSPGLPAAGLV